MNLKKKTIFIISLLLIPSAVFAYPFDVRTTANGYSYVYHEHNEESYQKAWCDACGGIMEYENKDKTRVDCLTQKEAVEFDFANKWHESIGQALHYGIMTGKKPMVVLILENQEQMKYYERVKRIAKKYRMKVSYVTNDILNLDENGKCFNTNCKCHRYENGKESQNAVIQQKSIHQNINSDVLFTVTT